MVSRESPPQSGGNLDRQQFNAGGVIGYTRNGNLHLLTCAIEYG
jgi:hypothetical protein